ncbi:hypothetical protein Pst134EB_018522 [Puccinia striiformis f. sp. tritici]|nr:hypothetical protein Pst134EB_018522 [Puccinia striiformis f. sp. tritici]
MNPANQEKYTAEEYAAMTSAKRQWLRNRPHHAEDGVVVDLTDYEDPVGSSLASSNETVRVEAALTTPSQPARLPTINLPPPPAPEFPVTLVTNPSKVLKNWPEEDSPKFCRGVGESAGDWLRTITVVLDDRQAHPGIWHRCAGQRLSGKSFRDWTDARLANTRPTDWQSFQEWLIRLSPLGTTSALLNSELNRLRQGSNEAVQLFFERFSEWQTRARTIGFAHDKQTAFVDRLNPGLSKKVKDWMVSQTHAGVPVTMDRIFMCAVSINQH